MWHKLNNNAVALAVSHMRANHLAYHNVQHVIDCFNFLEENEVEYDENLEYALWYHDAVYDEYPKKELRSAQLFYRNSTYVETIKNPAVVMDMIFVTSHHDVRKCANDNEVWMIKADLHALTNGASTVDNYFRINEESNILYDATQEEINNEAIKFLTKLSKTMKSNFKETNDEFWNEVDIGIQDTISINKMALRGT